MVPSYHNKSLHLKWLEQSTAGFALRSFEGDVSLPIWPTHLHRTALFRHFFAIADGQHLFAVGLRLASHDTYASAEAGRRIRPEEPFIIGGRRACEPLQRARTPSAPPPLYKGLLW